MTNHLSRSSRAMTRQLPQAKPMARNIYCAVLAMGLTVGTSLVARPAHAQESTASVAARKAYAIPAGALGETLATFASKAGVTIQIDSSVVEGRRSQALNGSVTVQEGFARLLSGSGLDAMERSRNIYVLRNAPLESTLPAVTVMAAPLSTTTEGTGSYAARGVSIAKGDQKLKDIPQSVSVLTRQRLDDQNIVDLRDAANQVIGLVGAKGIGQGMVLSARGFQIDSWQYDGVPIPRNNYALGNWGTESMVIFDRLEVLRGASGLLQGTGSPGGAVNLVRKRAPLEKTVTITGKAGSWDQYGLQLDAGMPLNEEKTLRGRFVIDESKSHSFIDYVNNDTRTLYAALDYDISPDTTIGFGVSNSNSSGRPMIRGLPLYADGSDIGLPRSTYTGAWWNRAEIDQTTIYTDLSHRFNNDWKMKVSALRMTEKNSSVHQRMQNSPAADGSGMTYANWATDFDSTKIGLDAFVNGRFKALSFENEITVGANYSKYTSDDVWARTFTTGGNIFAINNNRPWQDYGTIMAAGGLNSLSQYDVEQKGIYGSWRVRLSEPLTAVMGARVSWYDYLYYNVKTASKSINTASGEITPYFGLVYALNNQWSVYGSYTDVFVPQSQRDAQGNILDPVIGSNVEFGIKGELMDGQLNTSLAFFRYDQNNRAINDLAAGNNCYNGGYCSRAAGKVRSEGFDAEITGEIALGLQVSAGYTYNTTEFLEDLVDKGKVFSQWTPKHMLRVWANYQLPGEWNKLNVGGGVTTQSPTLGYNRAYKMPGFSVLNARASYQLTPEVSLALNINNLLDKKYYIPGFNEINGANDYGDPRNVMFTVKYTPKF